MKNGSKAVQCCEHTATETLKSGSMVNFALRVFYHNTRKGKLSFKLEKRQMPAKENEGINCGLSICRNTT